MTHDSITSNSTVATPEHGSFTADMAVGDETIPAVAAPGTFSGETEVDATGKHVLSGVIGPHTHHGIYRGLEAGAEPESKSDLVGGMTIIGNYFRRTEAYEDIMSDYFDKAEPDCCHDYFFSFGPLSMGHVGGIPAITEEFDIATFKWYMSYKDATCEKFNVGCDMHNDFDGAFVRKLVEQNVSTILGYHSKNVETTNVLADGNAYVISKPGDTDTDADEGYGAMVEESPGYAEIQSMVARATLARVHDYDDRLCVVHISVGETTDELAALHDAGYRARNGTCIHYLALITREYDEHMKVNPPVRSKTGQKALWECLADGTALATSTDHCANLAENKFGEGIRDSLFRFPSTPTMLPSILLEDINKGRISLEHAVEVMSTGVAKASDLYLREGAVRVDSDTDLAVVNLDETRTVMPELLHSISGYPPYEGRAITGWPTRTVAKGELAYDGGDTVGTKGYGTHTDRPV